MDDDNDDNVLIDRSGKGADDKAAFELRRRIIGKKLLRVRFTGNEEFEDGRSGNILALTFEDGGRLMVAVEDPGRLEIFLGIEGDETPEPVTERIQ